MSNKRYTFPAPVFASRVLRARLLARLSGKCFQWDDHKQKFVLKEGGEKNNESKRLS
jgi:hypothetical protein